MRSIMNSFVNHFFVHPTLEASVLAQYNVYLIVSSEELKPAVYLLLPEKLGKHTVPEGMKATTKYTSAKLCFP
uniref:Uncharacterized protein n=1 Tax=Apteryx owenii TaxID=8824 RepID=A0A8B9S2S8_APTOW